MSYYNTTGVLLWSWNYAFCASSYTVEPLLTATSSRRPIDLLTYPSPNQMLTLLSHKGQNFELGEG